MLKASVKSKIQDQFLQRARIKPATFVVDCGVSIIYPNTSMTTPKCLSIGTWKMEN